MAILPFPRAARFCFPSKFFSSPTLQLPECCSNPSTAPLQSSSLVALLPQAHYAASEPALKSQIHPPAEAADDVLLVSIGRHSAAQARSW